MKKEVFVIEDAAGAIHLKGKEGMGLCGVALPENSAAETLSEKLFHAHREACPECRVKLAQAVYDLLMCGRLNDTSVDEATQYIMKEGKLLKVFRG